MVKVVERVVSLVVFSLHFPDEMQPVLGVNGVFGEKVEFMHQKPRKMEKFIYFQSQNIEIETCEVFEFI